MPSAPPCSPSAFLQTSEESVTPERVLRPGSTIRQWRIVGPARAGGADEPVRYPVEHVVSGQAASLELLPVPPRRAGAYLVYMREVQRRVAQIHDRRAVTVHDVGAGPDGHPFVVRELLDGVTLETLVGDDRLSVGDAIELVDRILDVLIVAHAAGVAHGTLTLANVLVSETDSDGIRLLDWGMTAALAGALPATPADDVYALGLILARLLPETRPPRLAELLADMLAEVPEARPSIGEIAGRLALVEDELASPPATSVTPSPGRTTVELPDLFRVPAHPTSSVWRYTLFACAFVTPVIYLAVRFATSHDVRPIATEVAPPVKLPALVNAKPAAAPPAPQPAPQPMPLVQPAHAKPPPPHGQPEAQPPRPRAQPAKPAEPTADAELLRRYQRVGHDLIVLQKQIGRAQTMDLAADFHSIDIQAATLTASGRDDALSLLVDLERAIERNRPVTVSDACLDNPLANGCR